VNEQGPGQNRGLVYYWVVPSLKGGRAVSRAFVKESEDQLRILEKKKKYLLEDPAAVKIPAEKRKEMLEKYEAEAEEVKRLLDEMLDESRTP